MKSGAWSPSEPLVNISETGEVPDAGDVEEQDTTEVTPESSLGDALEGASPTGTPLSPRRTEVPKSGEETTTQIHVKCESSLSR